MSTVGITRAGIGDPDSSVDTAESRRRGNTVISAGVFEKIAGQAASEVPGARGRSGGVLGIGSTPDGAARPHVHVDLSEASVDLELTIGVAYPGSIRAAAQQVRERVSRTVHALTGVPVRRVDIDVAFLTPSTSENRRQQVLR